MGAVPLLAAEELGIHPMGQIGVGQEIGWADSGHRHEGHEAPVTQEDSAGGHSQRPGAQI